MKMCGFVFICFFHFVQLAWGEEIYPQLNHFQIESTHNQAGDDILAIEKSAIHYRLSQAINRLIENTVGIQNYNLQKLKASPIFLQIEKVSTDEDSNAKIYLSPRTTLQLIEFIHGLYSEVKSSHPLLNTQDLFTELINRIETTSSSSIFKNQQVEILIETNPLAYARIIEKLNTLVFQKSQVINHEIPFDLINSEFLFSSYKLVSRSDQLPMIFYSLKEQKLIGSEVDLFLTNLLLGQFPITSQVPEDPLTREIKLTHQIQYIYRHNEIQDKLKAWRANRNLEFTEELPYWIKLTSLVEEIKPQCQQLFLSSPDNSIQ